MKTLKIFLVIYFILFCINSEAQTICPTPVPITPTSPYQSVDPPLLAWHSVTFEGSCSYYLLQYYSEEPCGNPMYLLGSYTFGSGQDTLYYMSNSEWGGHQPYNQYYWVVKVASGDPLYGVSPCVPLVRLPASNSIS